MKIIEISDEIYEKIMDISKELNTQSPRGTAMPYIYRICYKALKPAFEGCGGVYILSSSEYDNYEINYGDNFKKEVKEFFESQDIRKPKGFTKMDDEEIKDYLEEEFEFKLYEYDEVDEYAGYFLTEKSAEEHLKANHYHYPKDAHTYLDHCWRSKDMEIVQQFFCEISGGKIHK